MSQNDHLDRKRYLLPSDLANCYLQQYQGVHQCLLGQELSELLLVLLFSGDKAFPCVIVGVATFCRQYIVKAFGI